MARDPNQLAEPLRSLIVDVVLPRAAKEGRTVTVVSARRSKAEQEALRRSNGCPDVYKSPASSCRVPTAIPGTSKHERGEAVDLGGDVEWVARTFPQLGRPVRGEPWHFEFTGKIPSATNPADVSLEDLPVVGGAVGGAKAVVDGLAVLTNPRTWLRVLSVVVGLALLAGAVALVVADVSPARGALAAVKDAR